jgi:hypothetical protein
MGRERRSLIGVATESTVIPFLIHFMSLLLTLLTVLFARSDEEDWREVPP